MREKVFLPVNAAVGVPVVMVLVRLVRWYLPRVHVQTVLAFLREPDQKRYEIVHDGVRYVFR